MKQMLLRVLSGESRGVESELRRRYNQFLKQSRSVDAEDDGNTRRIVPELFALAEKAKQQRVEREARALERKRAAEERKRRKYLLELSERFPETWEQIENLVEEMTGKAYERAVELLVDLSDSYDEIGSAEDFYTKFSYFASKYKRRTALVRRMKEAGLNPTANAV